ncbi:MAG: hypothetical protein J0M24_12900 [Verrucomicrobia bacterium]|nr:hypothetical protein [Verrucomicrobiota bacterium]
MRSTIALIITFFAAAVVLGQDASLTPESPAAAAAPIPPPSPCRSGWCAAGHTAGALPEWAQRIRDRAVAPASAEDGIWDPTMPVVTIDLLFLYTPTALAAEGSVDGINRRIDAMIATANRVFENSLTGVRINLVHVAQVNQPETANMVTAYSEYRNLASTQSLRENYKADIVFLLVEQEAVGFSAVADIGVARGNAALAFGAARRMADAGQRDMGLVLAHEIGHIFGATHDREHSYNTDLQLVPGVFPYSYGHRFEADGVTFRDVMSYEPGIGLPYFSNPRLTYSGQSLGVPAGQPGESDVSQTITRMAPFIARYRTANSRIGFTRSTLTVTEGDPRFTIELSREGDVSTSTRVNLTFSSSSSAKTNLDYALPTSVAVNFAAGQSNAVVDIELLQDELPEGDEQVLIGLGSVQGPHGLARQSSLTVTIVDDDPSFTLIPGPSLIREAGGEATWSVRFSGNLAPGESRTLDLVAGVDGDSAAPGVDYVVTPTTLVFTDTQRTQSFQIRALPDEVIEADESLRLTLGTLTAQLRIADDDRPGSPLPLAIGALNGLAEGVVARPDGRFAVFGEFSSLDGTPRSCIALVHPDSGLDTSFSGPRILAAPLPLEGMAQATTIQALPLRQGGWLVAGQFGTVDGQVQENLVRLKEDGSRDPGFRARINGSVIALVEQPDGGILVGGWFTEADGLMARGFVRLNADGSRDTRFRLEPGMNGRLASFARGIGLLPDGRILLGGYCEQYNGKRVSHLIRIHPDGSLDESFPLTRTGVNNPITALRTVPDGRAYVAGFFSAVGGRSYRGLGRLNQDGSVDLTFQSIRPNGELLDVLPLPNGQVLISGAFTQVAGLPRRHLALLNEDGTVDSSFDPGVGPSDRAFRLTALGDGSAIVTGGFASYAGVPAPGIARVRLPSISGSLTGITLRPDSTPEASLWGFPGANLTLESSTDLLQWSPVSTATIGSLDGRQTLPLPTAGDQRFFRIR